MLLTENQRVTSSVRLSGISWDTYEKLLRETAEQHVRMTYDRGELEFMSPLPIHEKYKALVRMLIEVVTSELGMTMAPFGSMTCKRPDLSRGLEPDECYYFKRAQEMWTKGKFDFAKDIPELAIDIDVTRSSIDRQGVYAALRVPELWRYDGRSLRVYHLIRGKYTLRNRSRIFPMLPLLELEQFLRLGDKLLPQELSDRFRKWIRKVMKAKDSK